MSIDSKIAEILEESKLAGLSNQLDEKKSVEINKDNEQGEALSKQDNKDNTKNAEAITDASDTDMSPEAKKAEKEMKVKAESVDVSADVAALMNGETLSEEFRTKAATIFEAAVVTRVKEEVTRLEEEFESKLAEQVEEITEGLVEKIDGYLDYVVEQWISENEIALENGVKGDIMESFITGMKDLFQEHYIDVPEEKYDVLGEMEAKIDALSAKLDEQVEKNIELKQSLQEAARKEIVSELSEGLVAIDSEKFHALVEELSFEDVDTFKTKVQTIRENYFTGKQHSIVESVVTDSPVEELNEGVRHQSIDPTVAAYVNAMKQLNQ